MNTPGPAVTEAIQWMVLLHSGEMTPAQHKAFLAWREQDPSHLAACESIEGVLTSVPQIREAGQLRQTLVYRGSRRGLLRTSLVVSALIPLAGFLYAQHLPIRGLMADIKTATGQRTAKALSDGSRLTLDARSAVDVDVLPQSRSLTVLEGLIHITVNGGQTPLVINSSNCKVVVMSGALTVESSSGSTRCSILQGNATVIASDGNSQVISAGQGGLIGAGNIAIRKISPSAEAAWLDGFVEVNNRPLDVLVARLRNYRPGVIRLDPEAAKLRVSGIFPLDNTDLTLESLQQTMPVVVTKRTPYWVTITLATS